MDPSRPSPFRWTLILFLGFTLLLFFEMVSDFVEAIYAFGLLGTSIPPEIVTVLLFFSPLLLLFFKNGLGRRTALLLALLVGFLRLLEFFVDTRGKLVVAGLGTGLLLLLLPTLILKVKAWDGDGAGVDWGLGLSLALSLSVLCRIAGEGSDRFMAAGIGLIPWIWQAWRGGPEPVHSAENRAATMSEVLWLCLGLAGTLLVSYFTVASPLVLVRWADLNPTLALTLLALGFAAGLLAFLSQRLPVFAVWLSKPVLLAGNALFLLFGTAGILLSQVAFPQNSSAFPIDQPGLAVWQQLPLYAMIFLSPIALLDFTRLAGEAVSRNLSPRKLAGGFAIAMLFFLLIVFAQVFTTVYDYIPVVGPLFRDKFWLVFLVAGLGMALPVAAVRKNAPPASAPAWSLLLLVLPLAVALFLIQNAQVAATPPAPQTASTLRVVTYNVQQGYSAKGERNYEGQLAVLKSLHADVIGLQETDTARFSGGNADLVRTFAQGLQLYSYYGPRTVTGTFGIALLSRYPIQNPRTFFMYSKGEQTAAIIATINALGKDFTVVVTHLGNDGPIIQQQQALSELPGRQNIILMGDFNFDATAPQYQLTVKTFADAWALANPQGKPGFNVDKQIDHVFVTPGLSVSSAEYIESPASDHPVELVIIQH